MWDFYKSTAKPWDFKSLAAIYQVRIRKVRLLRSESYSANFTLKVPAQEILILFCWAWKVQMNLSCIRVIFAIIWHFDNQGVKSNKSKFPFSNSQKEERKWIKVILPLLSHVFGIWCRFNGKSVWNGEWHKLQQKRDWRSLVAVFPTEDTNI